MAKSLVDVALLFAAFPLGIALSGRSSGGARDASEWIHTLSHDSIKRAIEHARMRGWIDPRGLTVSREGKKRLKTAFPEPKSYPQRWDGSWYLVSFDIPEKQRNKRDDLRKLLRRLGFASLHQSLWLSPYNFLGDVYDYYRRRDAKEFLVLFRSTEVGTSFSPDLARRLWKLDELDRHYERFLMRAKNPERPSAELMFEYLSIIANDPFLPRPLLPLEWHGEDAKKIYQDLISGRHKTSSRHRDTGTPLTTNDRG